MKKWIKISDSSIKVNIGDSPVLPFPGAEIKNHSGKYLGWLIVEKRSDGHLYVDDVRVILRGVPEGQVTGDVFLMQLSLESHLNANVLEALNQNPNLIPDNWKHRDENKNVPRVLFFGTIYGGAVGDYVHYLECTPDDFCYKGGDWLYEWLPYQSVAAVLEI